MDHEGTVYQYYTIVSDADNLIPDSDLNCIENVPADNDNIMYLSLGQAEEEVYPPNIVLSGVKTEEEDEDAAAVANIELITLEDGQMYMTGTSGLNEEYANNEELKGKELPQTVEPEKIAIEQLAHDNVELDSDYRKIQLEDGTCAYIDKVLWHSLIDDMEKVEEEKVVVAPKKEKKFRCTYYGCDKIYTTAHHLTVHLRNHTGSRPYQCEEPGCQKAFATGYSLKAHQRTHTGEAPYCCAVCPKQFKTSGDLQKHIRTHTGEKPFKCPIEGCGRSFTTSNIRKVHIRSHTGERPYSCTYSGCGKAFASATNFKNHMRIHSGERPYQCSVPGCGKKFTEYSSLFKHNAVHKPFKPLKCEYCDKLCKHEMTLKAHKHAMHKILITQDGTEIHLTKEKSGNYFMSSTV